jgi:hypothetical protein
MPGSSKRRLPGLENTSGLKRLRVLANKSEKQLAVTCQAEPEVVTLTENSSTPPGSSGILGAKLEIVSNAEVVSSQDEAESDHGKSLL